MQAIREVRFGVTALAGTGKQGILRPNSDGSYTMPVGGLDVYNSIGQYYPYSDAEALFTDSSSLMRRIANGALRGEYGHPKPLPGWSDEDFASRVMDIEETMVCCIFTKIWLDFDNYKDKDGRKIIAIMANIKPSGPYGPALKASFESADENVCFSIRSFTDDYNDRGIRKRALKHIVTWDYVNEPGIANASKFRAPGLESYTDPHTVMGVVESSNFIFTKSELEQSMAKRTRNGYASESGTENMKDLFTALDWKIGKESRPAYLDWKD